MPPLPFLLDRLGLTHPVIQAPMANASTPALAAAVSNAGGLGSLGVARMTPDDIGRAIRDTRALTNRAFNVNLFAPVATALDPKKIETARRLLAPFYREVGLAEVPPPPPKASYGFDDQLDAVLAERPPILSFAFNVLPVDTMRRIKASGAFVIGTATNIAEAKALEAAEVDAIVAQGSEAGGHRGTFIGAFEDSLIGLIALVPAIRAAVSLPVVAAGGIMDGAGVKAVLALGADAAQLGTAFLACPENSAVNPIYRRGVLDAAGAVTVVSRAFTGRHARMIKNRVVTALEPHAAELPDFSSMVALIVPLVHAAIEQDRADLVLMLAGQGVARTTNEPAAALVRRFASEIG
jgi:nitronate monooxygenase